MSDILNIKKLSVKYAGNRRPALNSISLDIPEGSVTAIVGESGSGKTTLVRSVIGLIPPGGAVAEGEIIFRGRNLTALPEKEYRKLRGSHISMIFQDPAGSFDPRKTIGSQYAEALRAHQDISPGEAFDTGCEMLSRLSLADPERVMSSYPFELSGGMAQRAAIAMAASSQSELILADEPTSALDATVQTEIVKCLLDLRDRYGKTLVMVTHNLAVAAYMADYIAVINKGSLAEAGSAGTVLGTLRMY